MHGRVILGLDRLTRHAAQMDREPELKIIRRAFAKQVMAAGGVSDPRVEAAFAAVAREDFLGPGPWQIVRWGGGYRTTPDPDPVYLYTDDVIGILPERNLNNGQPSLHAALIVAAAPQPGEHVVHVGAGVGYYTTILAELIGAEGRVTAIEFDAEFAARAMANLAQAPHVRVVHGDGTRVLLNPPTSLCQCWRDPARGYMAGPTEGGGKADLAVDGGRISEPRRAARGSLPD